MKLDKLMEKKKGEKLDPMYRDAKMSMLEALKNEMSGMMKDDLVKPGMKEVKVASNSPVGLKAGLEKAKDLIGDKDGMSDEGSEGDMPEHDEDGVEGIDDEDSGDVDHEMDDAAEDGDSEGAQHEASDSDEENMDDSNHVDEDEHSELSPEEIEQLEMLLAKMKRK